MKKRILITMFTLLCSSAFASDINYTCSVPFFDGKQDADTMARFHYKIDLHQGILGNNVSVAQLDSVNPNNNNTSLLDKSKMSSPSNGPQKNSDSYDGLDHSQEQFVIATGGFGSGDTFSFSEDLIQGKDSGIALYEHKQSVGIFEGGWDDTSLLDCKKDE